MNQMACNACGWVHFAVTRAEAEESVRRFNEFYDAAPDTTKEQYGGRARVESYLRCHRCGGSHSNFRLAQPDDCPRGCTLNPILVEGT